MAELTFGQQIIVHRLGQKSGEGDVVIAAAEDIKTETLDKATQSLLDRVVAINDEISKVLEKPASKQRDRDVADLIETRTQIRKAYLVRINKLSKA